MHRDIETIFKRISLSIENSFIGRHFLDKRFYKYTWIGIFISVLNVFLLWLLIDVIGIPTVISSIIVVGATFIFRYILFIFFKVF